MPRHTDKATPDQPPPPLGAAPQSRLAVAMVRVGLIAAAAVCITAAHGFDHPPIPLWQIQLFQAILVACYGLDTWFGPRLGRVSVRGDQPDWADRFLIILAAASAAPRALGHTTGWWVFELITGLILLYELWRLNVILSHRFKRPGALLPGSFLLLIAVGTPLLMLPRAVPPGQTITWIDACFTITSAVCVTGLTVRDTATQFSPFGQSIIAVFIQLGGLGIIIFGSMLAVLVSGRLSISENLSLRSMIQDQPLRRITAFVRFMVLTTLLLELLGAAAMMPMWPDGTPLKQRICLSLFHSISAFCNAGFSLQNDSFVAYRYSPYLHGVILPLIVIGGLGFPVLDNLWRVARDRSARRNKTMWWAHRAERAAVDQPTRLTLHTKIVLTTTAALYLYGVIGIGAGQLRPYTDALFQQGITANRPDSGDLGTRALATTLADASFMSLSARTAGFNSVPMDEISPAGRFVVITLMMVGASPGGTGGGMKTTTVALLLLSIAATIRQRERTEVFARTVSDALIRKAATLAACFIALACTSTLLLTLSEPYPFGKIAFEAVSAASTTGLSMGITGDLTAFGKCVLIVTMFAGRVGPLAVLGILTFGAARSRRYAYPREHVAMG